MRPSFCLVTVLAVAGALLAGGCTPVHHQPSGPEPARSPEPLPEVEVAEPSLEPVPEPAGFGSPSGESADDLLSEDEPLPGEEISEAAHDELSFIEPGPIDPLLLADLPQPPEPTFDIPMVHNDRVQFWLNYYGNRKRDNFRVGLERSGRYIPMFRQIFAEAGVPQDLVYMAHVESAYKTTAYSRAHARGIYQFMAATGRRYGLRIDYWVDDRLDPEKSARAAAQYLTDLHDEFGDWYLAMAGYNAGEGKIRRALRRSGRDDFWGIARTNYIRRETKNYVPAILAAIQITKQPGKFGLDYDPQPELVYETVQVEGSADLQVLATCADTDLETMKLLNPALRRYQTPPHATTEVRVPPGAAERTLIALAEVPREERVLYVRHQVQSGDTLYDLARAYNVTVSAIQQANKMGRRTMIRLNQELIIPSVAAGSYPATSVAAGDSAIRGETIRYRVRRGDTLSGIARRHGTSAAAIASASGISTRSVLSVGQRLTVVKGVRSSREAARIAGGPAPAPVKPGADGTVVHTVRRGESLSVIARRHRTTASAIAAANGISTRKLLQIGDRLTVVPGVRSSAEATRVASAGAGGDARVHTVRRGESLWTIANRYSTTIDQLCALNRISRRSTLYPGTKLTVRVE